MEGSGKGEGAKSGNEGAADPQSNTGGFKLNQKQPGSASKGEGAAAGGEKKSSCC